MKIANKRALTLSISIMLITSLLLINLNLSTSAQPPINPIYLHGPSLGPIHMHYTGGILYDLINPIGTYWHELYPAYCNYHTFTSLEDTNGILEAGDQIDMLNETSQETNWYFVDRITITLILSGPYKEENHTSADPTMAIELKLPDYDPSIIYYPSFMGTLWHEVWPIYSPVYMLTSFYDDTTMPPGGDGKLSFTDSIDLTDINNPQMPTFWHVEDVATDLILNKKVSEPVGTNWHELYPEYCNSYTIETWEDNQDGLLSPHDSVTLTLQPQGPTKTYDVENMNVTIKVQSLIEPGYFMYLDAVTSFEEMYYPKIMPYGYWWHEVWPYFSNLYYISNWVDNCNGVLGYCDNITLYTPEGGYYGEWHVEEVAVDMVVKEEVPTPPMYWKAGHPDYAPSGMPDFDQRQGGTYQWTDPWGGWTHCGPVAVANSLWWLDSEFESNTIPPPTYSDNFTLVSTYDTLLPKWDDHDPQNVPPLVEHLAYMMDTNGLRTGKPGNPSPWDTDVFDMQTGITQYLSWTGVNPQGDCDGNGIVDQTDGAIVAAAMGKQPGQVGWDMRADIDPVTTGWPNKNLANNVVNALDAALVAANMGKQGLFYEHTVPRPDFYYIEEEVERCQDVVLLLGFWYDSHGDWYREMGHYVTVAGINSETLEIAISNPIRDDFENGLAPGRSPVPHVHMPPEPPYITHNNASLVSQDIFKANFYPCPGGDWEILGYPGFDPADGWHVQIEYAVITSPLGVHDVAVTNITLLHDVIHGSKNGGQCIGKPDINVTVENQGIFPETFNVTCTGTKGMTIVTIGEQTVILNAGLNTTLQFDWDTTGIAPGNYTISASATLAGDADPSDNSLPDGTITVRLAGDVTGNNIVDVDDLVLEIAAIPSKPGQLKWNKYADIDCNNLVDIDDLVLQISFIPSKWP